jgi:hypothetical protein
LRQRLEALGIAPARQTRASLEAMLEENCGVHVEGTSEELAGLLLQMIDREPAIADRLTKPR